MKRRTLDMVLGAGVGIALLGGAILFAWLIGVSDRSTGVVCTLGKAVSSSKVERRAEESVGEFRDRVKLLRSFTRDLSELADCEVPLADAVHLKPKDRKQLRRRRAARGPGAPSETGNEGGGSQQTPPASQQPTPPPSGGGGSDDGGGGGNPPSNPPTPPNPPNPPSNPPAPGGGLLDPIVDDVCDLTKPILSLPAVCR